MTDPTAVSSKEPTGENLASLFAFNLGVELGQLAVVALFVPVAFFAARRWLWYRRRLVPYGSLAVAAVAAVWLTERVADQPVERLVVQALRPDHAAATRALQDEAEANVQAGKLGAATDRYRMTNQHAQSIDDPGSAAPLRG